MESLIKNRPCRRHAINGLVLPLLLVSSLNACGDGKKTVEWKQEVPLHDGRVIVLERISKQTGKLPILRREPGRCTRSLSRRRVITRISSGFILMPTSAYAFVSDHLLEGCRGDDYIASLSGFPRRLLRTCTNRKRGSQPQSRTCKADKKEAPCF